MGERGERGERGGRKRGEEEGFRIMLINKCYE